MWVTKSEDVSMSSSTTQRALTGVENRQNPSNSLNTHISLNPQVWTTFSGEICRVFTYVLTYYVLLRPIVIKSSPLLEDS